jgi:hypothetical protein
MKMMFDHTLLAEGSKIPEQTNFNRLVVEATLKAP